MHQVFDKNPLNFLNDHAGHQQGQDLASLRASISNKDGPILISPSNRVKQNEGHLNPHREKTSLDEYSISTLPSFLQSPEAQVDAGLLVSPSKRPGYRHTNDQIQIPVLNEPYKIGEIVRSVAMLSGDQQHLPAPKSASSNKCAFEYADYFRGTTRTSDKEVQTDVFDRNILPSQEFSEQLPNGEIGKPNGYNMLMQMGVIPSAQDGCELSPLAMREAQRIKDNPNVYRSLKTLPNASSHVSLNKKTANAKL